MDRVRQIFHIKYSKRVSSTDKSHKGKEKENADNEEVMALKCMGLSQGVKSLFRNKKETRKLDNSDCQRDYVVLYEDYVTFCRHSKHGSSDE